GRNTNPIILRVGNITRNWDSKWFADRRSDFRRHLREDLIIRTYLQKHLRMAAISRLEIARQPRETLLTIHTSRPAVVIGRGGSNIEKLQKDLAKLLWKGKPIDKAQGKPIRVNVQEVRNPDTDAVSVATQVMDQIERRMPFRRVLKGSVGRAMQAGAKGIKVQVAGRLNGAEIARTEWLAEGNVPLQTFRSDVSYALKTAVTSYGTIGIKVWINRGDLLQTGETEEKPKEVSKRTKTRRRISLADKAKKARR
ncbi:MAG: 30S ribosomal protein S3, partial [Patescibacteria group bacterium]